MRRTPAFAAALLTISLALAGCGANDSTSQTSASDAKAVPAQGGKQEGAGAADRAAQAPGSEGVKASAPPSRAGTHVIRTAELTVRVKDTQKALSTARDAAVNAGGLVENESTERDEDSYVMSRIVLRVPQDEYDSVLAELTGTGTLLARKANAKDVTDQVVDVDSRIASQRVSVARIRELMDRATKLGDVVALEGELSSRQAALESLLAQQASLKDRTTLATITLELSEAPVVKPEKKEEDPGFLDALGGGWDAFTATLRWIAVVIGAVAPFAVALAVLYALWRLARRLLPVTGAHQGRPTTVPAAPEGKGSTAPAGPAPGAAPED
ncbi:MULTISPECIES: DUF4349 domain-containing protein [unclassified Streptomyces]|uniref:DUF4349 domain-containing protein n=1 Tax=unclassified Streptomyces TaxID=2593676 RepID=UPI00081EF974|nr:MULTISPECIES: DUF4349 domain-containing protein [unclassified Streptomyces]MYZ39791.1 DUF4349 domain-containing protein [Streptomyces sp. SID4917]SCG05269.1 protein of unknown function [Streptomyces sp. MnatMP-M17]